MSSKRPTIVSQSVLDGLLSDVDKPARYTGGETNSCVRPEPQQARMALCFPDVYEVAESHLGLKILYEIINGTPGFAAERVYALWPDLEERAREAGVPLWSLETRRSLCDFDVVGFTLQYELAYPTVLAMLEHGGITLRSDERDEAEPIVIGGGACTCNPEPLADHFDAFLLGDGEEAVLEILGCIAQYRDKNALRREILAALAAIDGIYVPAHYHLEYDRLSVTRIERIEAAPPGDTFESGLPRVRRRAVTNLDATRFPVHPVVPNVQPVHDRVAVEVQRGCTRGCRFCQAGMIARPTRQRRASTVMSLVDQGVEATGCDKVGLLSLSAGDWGPIQEVLVALFERYSDEPVSVSLPSMRTETLSEDLAQKLARVRKSSFTLAPEAGSERLRLVINKNNTDEDLLAAVRSAVSAGWRHLKLYFMIGLPTEQDEDLDAIVELAKRARAEGRKIRGHVNVTVSVSTFIAKPHTPLQWEAQLDVAETRARQQRLRDKLRKSGIELRWHAPEQSFVEGVLARGDRRLGRAMELAAQAGCRLDAWTERFDLSKWQQAFERGLSPHALRASDYLDQRDKQSVLAWEHLDYGVLKKYLLREARRAYEGLPTSDCALDGGCHACGGCDLADPYLMASPQTDTPTVTLQPDLAPAKELRAPSKPRQGAIRRTASNAVARSRLRFRFSKRGRAIHFSQLDVVGQVTRAVRQSGLPVLYSEGHSPRPRLSFSPACPTGIESFAEYFEAECSGFPDVSKYLDRLNCALPDGIEVIEGCEITSKEPSFNEQLSALSFCVELPGELLEKAEQQAARLEGGRPFWVKVKRKGKSKLLDASSCIERVHCQDSELHLTLAFSAGASLKIGEALAVLLGSAGAAAARVRKTSVRLGRRGKGHAEQTQQDETIEAELDLTLVSARSTQRKESDRRQV